jgi:oligoendopeptidase F
VVGSRRDVGDLKGNEAMTATATDFGTRARADVPPEDTWDLTAIYADRAAWEADMERVRSLAAELAAMRGTLAEGAGTLSRALELEERVGERLIRAYAWAALKKDQDTADSSAQADDDRATRLYVEVSSQTAFLEPEILALPEGTVERYLAEKPGLEKYRHALESILRQREHVLDSDTETLLASAGEIFGAPGTIFGMLNDADMEYGEIENEQGEAVTLTKANFQRFIESRDRRVRRDAFTTMHAAYRKQRNTIAATHSSSVKTDIFMAKTHRYDSALEAALYPNNIPVSVYDALVEAVNAHLPLLHRYIALRKRALGLDRLGVHDLYVPIVPEVEDEYDYADALDTMLGALGSLGDDYVRDLGAGLDSRWADIYENKGKRSGAYSFGVYGVHPFILLNWSSKLRDVFTLAHEAGHAMHSFYTSQAQPYVYGNYTIFVAEVASTVNEILLTERLRAETDDPKLDMYLVNHALEDLRGTLYRQTMFAEFERWTHERVEAGEALTHDALSAKYAELAGRYYGPDVEIDEYVAIEWARIPHFYRAFYVYQYATGISAAVALARRIMDEGEPARQRYRKFLAGGSSKYSLDLLRDAGVDMTSPEPVAQALEMFGGWVDELEQLMAGQGLLEPGT